MANRILRDWTDSEKINQLSVHAERFFTRLIMKVDDFGRFPANEKLLKSNLFPLLDSIRDADISRWINECANITGADGKKSGLITVYEVNHKRYVQINDFRQRLDRAKAKYPEPLYSDNDPRESDNEFPPEVEKKQKLETEVETETKVKVRDYVTLTHAEHVKLVDEFGNEETNWMLDKLNAFKGSKGKKYKSDYLAIYSWVIKALKEDKEKSSAKKESKADANIAIAQRLANRNWGND